jgi:hypothetical protein
MKAFLKIAEVDPEMRELMREKRTGVEQFATVDFLPLVGRAVCRIALSRQWKSWRAKAEEIEQKPLIVTGPPVWDEAGFGLPAMRNCRASIQSPLPVGPRVQRFGQLPNLGLLLRVRIEVGGAGEHPREKER